MHNFNNFNFQFLVILPCISVLIIINENVCLVKKYEEVGTYKLYLRSKNNKLQSVNR